MLVRLSHTAVLRFDRVARRGGVHEVGPAIVRASDRLGATTIDGPLGEAVDVRVYASVQRLRRIVAPLRTRPVLSRVRTNLLLAESPFVAAMPSSLFAAARTRTGRGAPLKVARAT